MYPPLKKAQPAPEGVSKPVAALVHDLQSRWRFTDDRVHAALALPDIATSVADREYATSALRRRLELARPHRRHRSLVYSRVSMTITMVAVLFACAYLLRPLITGLRLSTGSTIRPVRLPVPSETWSMVFYASLAWLAVRSGRTLSTLRENATEVRSACARSLGLLGDEDTLAILAKYSHDDHNSIAYEARRAVLRVLPALHDNGHSRLAGQTSRDLARLLPVAGSAAEAAIIMRALMAAGSPEALPEIECYSRTTYTEETTLLAADLISVLKHRQEIDRKSTTLLRPAESATESLLRPALQREHDPEHLLHVVQKAEDG
jgi:hypothetical protein